MINKNYKTTISKMGDKKIMNVPKAVEHLLNRGDKILFCKEDDYNEEQKKYRSKNNK